MGLSGTDTEVIDLHRRHIVEHLRQHLPAARDVRCLSTRSLGYSLSFVFEISPDGHPPFRVFAKIRRPTKFGGIGSVDDGGRARRLAEREFETLERAHRWFSVNEPRLGVVEPVAYVEAANAVVVRAARGWALDALVSRGSVLSTAAVARCGHWLRCFHRSVSTATSHPWSAAEFGSKFERVLGELARAGTSEKETDRVRARVLEQAQRFDGLDCTRTLVHGDFKLRHIWATQEQLQVLDFGNVHEAATVEDLASFLVELEVLDLATWKRTGSNTQTLSAVFLDAYGPIESPPVLALQLVLARIKKWARRRTRVGHSRRARRLDRLMRASGIGAIFRRAYLDPWFRRRIDDELAWLVAQPVEATAGLGFTGRLAAHIEEPDS